MSYEDDHLLDEQSETYLKNRLEDYLVQRKQYDYQTLEYKKLTARISEIRKFLKRKVQAT